MNDLEEFDFLEDEEEPICLRCGKPIYDFSDLGCGYCDARHPEFGLYL